MTVELICGDCLEILPTLASGSVDAVVTDLPYSEKTHRGARTRTTGAESQSLIPFAAIDSALFCDIVSECLRISRSWVVTFCDWKHAAEAEKSLPLVRLGVWVKPNSAPQLTGDRPAQGWEAIAFFHKPGRKTWNGGGRRGVWTYPCVRAEMHPTQKPLELLTEMVKLFSNEGDTILDPFMGSGTTGVACVQTGRSFIGIEIDPTYFAIAQRRIAAAQAQLRMPLEVAVTP